MIRATDAVQQRLGKGKRMQKALVVIVILFAGFFLLTQPGAAADVVKSVVEIVGNVFDTVIQFLNALFD